MAVNGVGRAAEDATVARFTVIRFPCMVMNSRNCVVPAFTELKIFAGSWGEVWASTKLTGTLASAVKNRFDVV